LYFCKCPPQKNPSDILQILGRLYHGQKTTPEFISRALKKQRLKRETSRGKVWWLTLVISAMQAKLQNSIHKNN
jgi:hypothetical protein